MGKYRLKANAGAHHHDDGRVYTAGEVVDSRANLALAFREKFEVVDGPQPVFVGPAGGRTGNELPQDHSDVRTTFETDAEADDQAKRDNARLKDSDNDGVDLDQEDLAEDIAAREDGSPAATAGASASAGRPKRNAATTAATRRTQGRGR